MQLRQYQKEAIEAFINSVNNGYKRNMIVLPTGTGKTVLGLSLAKAVGGRTLWLAHREELITQPLKAIKTIWPEVSAGIVKADRDEYARDVVFASVQTAWRKKRLEKLKNFDLVIIDESHHSAAKSYKKIIDHVGCFNENGPPLLGLTATPERSDNFRLDDIFQNIVYQFQLKKAVEDGYLVDVEMIERPINLNLDSIKTRKGDFNEHDLDLALLNAGIIEEVCLTVDELAKDKKTIIFTVSVKQAKEISEKLSEKGYKSGYISGETPNGVRKKRLKQLSTGEITHMVNCMVLTEGFDEPTVNCVIMARPTQSKSLYIQCIGRGLRISPNKKSCTIIDMVGTSSRHTLIQAPVIFGIEKEIDDIKEKSKSGDVDEFLSENRQKSTLLSQITGIKSVARSALRWIPNGDNLLLHCGQGGTIVMRPFSENDWIVEIVDRGNFGNREFLTMDPVDLELAQGIAEDYVRRSSSIYLTSKAAKWRQAKATEAQKQALDKWKIKYDPSTLSKGEASDLLTKISAGKSWKNEPATHKQKFALRRLGIHFEENITKGEVGKLIKMASNNN